MNNNINLFKSALENYQSGNLPLAFQLCNKILQEQAENTGALKLLGVINLQKGNPYEAAELFNKLVSCSPDDASAHLHFGKAQYMLGNIDEAASAYDQAVNLQSDLPQAQSLLQSTRIEIKKLDDLIGSLDVSNKAPSIKFSAEEIKGRSPSLTTLNKGVRLFKHFGYLIIEDLFSEQFISDLHNDFKKDYAGYFKGDTFDDALKVGDKRIMVSLKLQGLFNNTDYYANPLIMPILARLLGRDFILFSLGGVVSLPGAANQHTHKDHRALFEDGDADGSLPSFAVTMGIPLIEMNEINGTTRMYGKTHNKNGEKLSDAERELGISPAVHKGSCMLFDYRVLHEGTPNNSENVRPLMYNVYSRAWFRDCQNYKKQKSILVTDDEYNKVPETHRHLISWIQNE